MDKFWYDSEVKISAKAFDLEPELVTAIVMVESAGRTNAYRYEPNFWLRYMANKPEYAGGNPYRLSASYGLMQVMYATAHFHGFEACPEVLFQPAMGLTYGCKHLRKLLNECDGDVEMALAQYNGGKSGNTAPPFRNAGYVLKVMKTYHALKGEQP